MSEFSAEFRERAVWLALDNKGYHGSRWQAVMSISAKFGGAPQTLNDRVKRAKLDSGKAPVFRPGTEKLNAGTGEPRTAPGERDLSYSVGVFAMAEFDRRSK